MWTNVVPGTLCLHVEEVRKGPAPESKWTELAETFSVPLAALREALGAADEGVILDPFGKAHPISLKRWSKNAPATRLLVWFSYQQNDAPEGLRGTIYPPDMLARARPAAITTQ
jgi:hypothetical protein